MTGADRVALLLPPGGAAERRDLERRCRRRGFDRFARRRGRGLQVDGVPGWILPAEVGSARELAAVLARPGPGLRLFRWRADRVIPLEAALAGRVPGRSVGVVAARPEEVPAALGALERGADLVVAEIDSAEALDRLERALDRPVEPRLRWRYARLRRVEPSGTSDRVLVDTTRLLRREEGLLVGSAARFLFLVASEAEGSEFSRPRPFRVNAGAPHSYVLLADGSTRYLSELEPGDRVLVAAPRTAPGVARVGRLKIEHRPMVLVEAEVGAARATIFLQEAETVRLFGPHGTERLDRLGPGDRLLGAELPAGRHLGVAVEERVEER